MDDIPTLPEGYAEALGFAILAWAGFETSLDILVAIAFNGLGGHPKHQEIPRSLSRKTEYLRDFARLRPEHPWSVRILQAADIADELREDRHHATHGIVSDVLSADEAKVFRVLYEKTIHKTYVKPVSVVALKRLYARTKGATLDALNLSREMTDALKDFYNKPSGEGAA